MARTATKATSKAANKSRTSKPKPVAEQPKETQSAFSYASRVAVVTDTLKRIGGSATLTELFTALQKSANGRELFAKPRRISATWRQNVRLMSAPPWLSESGVFRLAKRSDRTATSKPKRETASDAPVTRVSARNRAGGKVSRKRTRSA